MIKILLVNQVRFLCNALASVLEDENDMTMVGSANTVEETLFLAPHADVVLVNTQLENGDAFRHIRALKEANLPVKILAMGLTESREQVLQYVQAGANGYVLKDDSVEDLLERVRGVCNGQVRVSPKIASALIARLGEYSLFFQRNQAKVDQNVSLTTREQEILDLISQDYTNSEIAAQLFIEVGTVKNHVHRILQKMDASTRQEAAATWVVLQAGDSLQAQMMTSSFPV
ncbi:MAG: response regulator transcription factor [Anaerolineales bacterium]|jgi:DNA-binding NarL/FixJ family response regulator|nr:response regulator transcription factor [Anaerolineales bacterium]